MRDMLSFDRISLIYFLHVLVLILIVWEVNVICYKWIKKRSKHTFLIAQYVILSFFALLFFVIPTVYFFEFYFEKWFDCEEPSDQYAEFVQNIISSTFFVVVFIGVTIVKHFYDKNKKTELIKEKIEKENIQFKYESLRNQINPHFLFNSFSVLNSLVYKNPETASEFISQLSKIYRYVIEFKEKELALLSDELNFLKSYVYLLKIRHDESIVVNQNISQDVSAYSIPSLSLQLLAENAAKHNKFSIKTPLIIDIHLEHNFLVIQNTINKRTYSEVSSTGIGLQNIVKRYKLGNYSTPVITKDNNFFIVKLPLIKND